MTNTIESKLEKFIKLGEGRTDRAVKIILSLGNLANSAYAFEGREIKAEEMYTALKQAIKTSEECFNKSKASKTKFTFTSVR
tara:strand:+ start:415 stop:660 length:246 start_codon:yes stop_codon:yes gene_type:complete